MCYSCNNTGMKSLAVLLWKSYCDLLFSAVAKDTISAWRGIWRQTMGSSSQIILAEISQVPAWIVYPHSERLFFHSAAGVVISFTLCVCVTCLLTGAARDSSGPHMCWKWALFRMTDLWHEARAADINSTLFTFSLISAQQLSANGCVSFRDEVENL